jgi:hypothetical protein
MIITDRNRAYEDLVLSQIQALAKLIKEGPTKGKTVDQIREYYYRAKGLTSALNFYIETFYSVDSESKSLRSQKAELMQRLLMTQNLVTKSLVYAEEEAQILGRNSILNS